MVELERSKYKLGFLALVVTWLVASVAWPRIEIRLLEDHYGRHMQAMLNDQQRNRVILAGGSNAKYGYRASAWGPEARNYGISPVAAGDDHMYLRLLAQTVKPGDTVVLSLLSSIAGKRPHPAAYVIAGANAYESFLNSTIPSSNSATPMPFIPLGWHGGQPPFDLLSEIYNSRQPASTQGDLSAYQCSGGVMNDLTESILDSAPCIGCIESIAKEAHSIQEGGASVYIQFPWVHTTDDLAPTLRTRMDQIERLFNQKGVRVLRSALSEVYTSDLDLFCDDFHLNARGATHRTLDAKAQLQRIQRQTIAVNNSTPVSDLLIASTNR